MPGLWWRSNSYTLNPAAEDIGDVYAAIASSLPTLGYTGIAQSQDDVHGVKGDFFVVVAYLYLGDQAFIRLVMLAFDGASDAADTEIQSVINMIDNLKFA
jgi:hypothetical protein